MSFGTLGLNSAAGWSRIAGLLSRWIIVKFMCPLRIEATS
jgi:hypothetical protein